MSGISGYPDQRWTAECHPREREVTAEVNAYFLQHWPFPDEKARHNFVKSGYPRVNCFYVARALDDRIHFACRVLTVGFLIDGEWVLRSCSNPITQLHCTLWLTEKL